MFKIIKEAQKKFKTRASKARKTPPPKNSQLQLQAKWYHGSKSKPLKRIPKRALPSTRQSRAPNGLTLKKQTANLMYRQAPQGLLRICLTLDDSLQSRSCTILRQP